MIAYRETVILSNSPKSERKHEFDADTHKFCFLEKISMKRKIEKMKDYMEKTVITPLFKLISPNYMQWKHCEITVTIKLFQNS